MPKLARTGGRGAGAAWAAALVAWDIWKRIPLEQRQRLLAQARKHGPRIVKQAVDTRRRRRGLF